MGFLNIKSPNHPLKPPDQHHESIRLRHLTGSAQPRAEKADFLEVLRHMAEHSQKAKEPTFPSIRCITAKLIHIYTGKYIYIYKDPNNTQRSCAPFTIHISTASLHLFSDFSVFFSLFSCKHQGLCEESLRRLPCPDHLILRCRVVVFSFYHLGGSGEKLHGGWSIQAIWGGSMNEKNQPYAYFTAILWIFDTVDVSWIFVDNCTYFFQNDWPFQNVGSIGRWLFIRCFQICLGYHDWFRYRDFLEIFIFRASKHMLMTRHEDFNASTPGKEGLEDRDEVSEPNASMRDMIMQQRYLSIQYQLKTPKTYHIITPSCDYTSSHQASFCYIFP